MGTQWEHVKLLLPDTAALFLPYPVTWTAGCWLAVGMARASDHFFNPARARGWQPQGRHPSLVDLVPIHPSIHPSPRQHLASLAARSPQLAAAVWARIPGCGPATDPQGPPAHRSYPVLPRRSTRAPHCAVTRRVGCGTVQMPVLVCSKRWENATLTNSIFPAFPRKRDAAWRRADSADADEHYTTSVDHTRTLHLSRRPGTSMFFFVFSPV
jgi:hypothetical protein